MTKTKLPTHIGVLAKDVGLLKDSTILLEQIRTIDKTRLKEKMGHLDPTTMNEVNNAIGVSFGLSFAPQENEQTIESTTQGTVFLPNTSQTI
jgi:mRNA interferase MazF